MRALRPGFLLLGAALALPAQELGQFEKKVTEFSLANGLHFILMERHSAPVAAFHTYVNAGSVDDPPGKSGLAHLFERVAFQGTETIGTKNWAEEKRALDAIEEAYDRLDAERNQGPKADPGRVETLQTQVKLAVDRAQLYVRPDEYQSIIEENGGVGLQANVGLDATEFSCSLPSNRIELWFLMESQRLLHPVFRQFYTERDAAIEEQRRQVDSQPEGKLMQSLLATAFVGRPYRNPGAGLPREAATLRRADAAAFFEKYYVPGNITIAIVGDVNPAEARHMAERYFGQLPARPLPSSPRDPDRPQSGPSQIEPPQAQEKTVRVDSPAQAPAPAMAAIGYPRPSQFDQDDPVLDVIQLILSSGRAGMLPKEMVEDKRVSQTAQAVAAFPAGRYPNLFLFFLRAAQGRTAEDNEKALDDLLARFKDTKVDLETLQRAKIQARASAVRLLSTNSGLARTLAVYSRAYGDWRKLFHALDDLQKATADDVQRAAQKYFVAANRTIAYTSQGGRP